MFDMVLQDLAQCNGPPSKRDTNMTKDNVLYKHAG